MEPSSLAKTSSPLLRAFDQLEPDGQERDLVVVGGRGWQDRQLVRELEARTAGRRVRWLGYVSETDLVALYSGADLFVLASTFEGFGLPVLEAMACGTPVIASDVAALREVGGDVARFVPPGDSNAFANAIALSLRDGSAAASARVDGPLRAAQFSWTKTAEALWARARTTGPTRVWAKVEGVPRSLEALPPPVHPAPQGLSPREWSLLATVVYADLFESALPVTQALTVSAGAAFEEAELRRLVRGPALAPRLVLHPTGFLTLAGREHLVDAIPEREARTRQLLERSRKTLGMLSALPFVRSLVTSGGVAHRNAGSRPDVDLFVVAARGRAYTAYTLIVLATKLNGTRHLICPNYVVDESELAVAYHRDLFTAHQLASAWPLSGQPAYDAWCCAANAGWVRRFFPAFGPRDAPVAASAPPTRRSASAHTRTAGRDPPLASRAGARAAPSLGLALPSSAPRDLRSKA